MENALPDIPPKRYFTIGEVSELCGVKPYVLRYWEQEFTQLRPMKRRGNRRYYQHHEVLLIRRIRDLLYEKGFTISGARNRLAELGSSASKDSQAQLDDELTSSSLNGLDVTEFGEPEPREEMSASAIEAVAQAAALRGVSFDLNSAVGHEALRAELLAIRELLKPL
jgi:DNA-binding transcriptional MerR regulator